MTEIDPVRRAVFTAGLRKLADFLDANPIVPCPYGDTMNAFISDREELTAIARLGNWQKNYCGSYFALAKQFGEISFEVNTNRETVCRKVVVGQRIVPRQPAIEAHVESIEEWVCDDVSLLREA